MRHLAPALVLVLAGSAVRAADEAPSIDPSAFTVTLSQVHLNRDITFTNGDLAHGTCDEHTTVMVNLRAGNGVEVVSVAAVTVDAASTDLGEQLAGPQQSRAFGMSRAMRHLTAKQGYPTVEQIQLVLRYPTRPVKTLTKVTGTIEVLCETAPGETITLAPASDWVGKKRDVPGSALGFTLLSLDPVKYACDRIVLDDKTVASLDFLDAQGKELPNFGAGGSSDGTTVTTTRNGVKLPPTGSVRIVMTGKTTTVRVPIALTDIPLQAPPRPEPAPALAPQPQPPAEKPGKQASDF